MREDQEEYMKFVVSLHRLVESLDGFFHTDHVVYHFLVDLVYIGQFAQINALV
jgi:hypothetical protein